MGQRVIVCTNQMPDLEMDQQGPDNLHPEHCVFLGNIAHFPHPNFFPVLSGPGNTSNVDLHHLAEHHESNMFYANQFNGLQHHHSVTNLNLGPPSHYYNPYMAVSSMNRICPVPLISGSSDQPPSSSNPGITNVPPNDYDGSNHFMDGSRSSGKRKNAECFPGNHPINGLAALASSSSSSAGSPQNTGLHSISERFESGAGLADVASFQPPEYRANALPSRAGTSRRSVRSRSNDIGHQVDSNLIYNHNHLSQGSHVGQSFHSTGGAWVEQQFGSNGSDNGSPNWGSTPAMPFLHGRNANLAPMEITSMSGQGYPLEIINGRRSTTLLQPSSMQHHHFHPHLQPPPLQSMRGHNYHPHASIPSYMTPASNNLNHGTLNPYFEGQERAPRYPRPFPSNGLRIYRPYRSGMRQTALENNSLPYLRVLSEDDVAILEFPRFYEVGSLIDQHRDMRLDIDDMSYEELLALGERIGNVKTGLSEENISRSLKTRVHSSSCREDINCDMRETCIICQLDYEKEENVGILECGHEYHADCIKQWLTLKNVCPICKMPALTVDGMNDR
ncbi:hypothetical protein Syun_027699 [Stephania yunnanensis]|uniref:RING-type E3 ubiquitin transferase n=1 Tax=Stephania yunnanensis TaxID=152371 RepID=A0AAP0HLA0_9MAGN